MSMDHLQEAPPDQLSIDHHLNRVLSSSAFRQAPRQQRLLRYLVDSAMNGDPRRLKEYTLGVEVFDRPVDFDPTTSALVRVEVGRLRSKLVAYYSDEGAEDTLRLDVPKGGYNVRIQTHPISPPRAPADARPRERPSIAVLPLHFLSGPENLAWSADGVTEDLITDLSKLSGLQVCSRHSSFACRGTREDIRNVAQRLGVRYLLGGSVRIADATVRITAHLTDAQHNTELWADRFEAPLSDMLRLQAGIAERVVAVLQPTLTTVDIVRLGREETASPEAHALVIQGLGELWKYAAATNLVARAKFEAAIAIDPDYASAHAWRARALMADYVFRWNDSDEAELNLALGSARSAVEADSLLPLGHAVLCWAELWARNAAGSLAAGERAVRLDPNSGDARLFYSVALSASRRAAEAQTQIEIAMQICPQPPVLYLWAFGLSLQLQDRLAEAAQVYRECIKLRREYMPAHVFLASTCLSMGQRAAAGDAVAHYRALFNTNVVPLRRLFFDDLDHHALFDGLRLLGMEVLEPFRPLQPSAHPDQR